MKEDINKKIIGLREVAKDQNRAETACCQSASISNRIVHRTARL